MQKNRKSKLKVIAKKNIYNLKIKPRGKIPPATIVITPKNIYSRKKKHKKNINLIE